MAREFSRSQRVADALQRSLAQIIPKEIRDPRLGMVNINEVVVARDLTTAKIYVTFVGLDNLERAEESVDILNNAVSYLRSLLGKELHMRGTPKLKFYYDETSVKGNALSQLIDRAVANDQRGEVTDENVPDQDRTSTR